MRLDTAAKAARTLRVSLDELAGNGAGEAKEKEVMAAMSFILACLLMVGQPAEKPSKADLLVEFLGIVIKERDLESVNTRSVS